MGKAAKFELTFIKKEKKSHDAYSFYFDRVKHGSKDYFDFIPGQYLKLFLDIENPDERGSSRYFTISSSPTDKDFLTITTRILKSSFKLRLDTLKIGEKVRAFGPIGYFDFDLEFNKPSIFLAGGIGITPFHSLIRYLDFKKKIKEIYLFSSFPYRDEVLFFEEMKKIETKNPALKIVYSLTKEEKKYSGFENGRINENMIKKYTQNYYDCKFYITGPEKMVLSMFEMIRKSGIAEKNIFKEDFPGY